MGGRVGLRRRRHFAPHALVDVQAIGCDFLACSAYKFYGPHVGLLWGRYELLASLDVRSSFRARRAPERVETGTQNHEVSRARRRSTFSPRSVAGPVSPAAGALRAALVASYDATARATRCGADAAACGTGCGAIAGVTRYGRPPGQPRTPTVVVCRSRDTRATRSRRASWRSGLFVSSGDFYAQTLVERLGHGHGRPGPHRLRVLHDGPGDRSTAGRRSTGVGTWNWQFQTSNFKGS